MTDREKVLAHITGLEDGRVRPVLTYDLDRPGRAVARECGMRLAERTSLQEWSQADQKERAQIARELQLLIAHRLGTRAGGVNFESDTTNHGSIDLESRQIDINADHLLDDGPRELIMTIAHEQRHGWQKDVIDGLIPHPDGSEGRERLVRAYENYRRDRRRFDRYAWNEMERDGETFAFFAYREFLIKQNGCR